MPISDLICILLGHEADPVEGIWNGSICFAKCARCGEDLVRTVEGKWRLPRGYRVVWRPVPKEEAPAASLAEWPEPEIAEPLEWEQPWEPEETPAQTPDPAPAEAQQVTEWPIARAPRADKVEAPVAAAEPAMPLAPADDFMADEADEAEWDDLPGFLRRSAAR